jgi:uncharacterized membrane protein YbhN (UPF0104 family)
VSETQANSAQSPPTGTGAGESIGTPLAAAARRAVPSGAAPRATAAPASASDAPSPSSIDRDAHRLRNGLIWTGALILLLLGIALAVPDLREVLDRIADASPGWLMLGVGLELLSCLGYVATVRLVLRRGPKREVRWLAWAEMAFGAVVPLGGAGGLAVGAWAMRAWGIAWERIANRSAVIFLLTSAVNAAVLALAGFGVWLGIGSDKTGFAFGLVPALPAAVGLGLFMLLPVVLHGEPKGRISSVLYRMADWVRDTEKIAFQPNWRLLGTAGYLLFDMGVLWVCLRAVGEHPPVLALIVAYQIGYLANMIPIPGGVGALEGGLVGALLLYGMPAGATAAGVVLYHAIALWVPTLGGTIGFARLRKVVAAGPAGIGRAPAPETSVAAPREGAGDAGSGAPTPEPAPRTPGAARRRNHEPPVRRRLAA